MKVSLYIFLLFWGLIFQLKARPKKRPLDYGKQVIQQQDTILQASSSDNEDLLDILEDEVHEGASDCLPSLQSGTPVQVVGVADVVAEPADGNKKQVCPICFAFPARLSDHVRARHCRKKERFECPRCPVSFKNKRSLHTHLRVRHQEENYYYCPKCAFSTNDRKISRAHSLKHKKQHYECPSCSFSTDKMKDFISHCQAHDIQGHKEENPEIQVQVNQHQESFVDNTLSVGKVKLCPYPGCMQRVGNMKRHLLIHAKQGIFRCQYCDDSFVREDALRVHLKKTHKLANPYLCALCAFSTETGALLQRHYKEQHSSAERSLLRNKKNKQELEILERLGLGNISGCSAEKASLSDDIADNMGADAQEVPQSEKTAIDRAIIILEGLIGLEVVTSTAIATALDAIELIRVNAGFSAQAELDFQRFYNALIAATNDYTIPGDSEELRTIIQNFSEILSLQLFMENCLA